jgi:hypothetical protein
MKLPRHSVDCVLFSSADYFISHNYEDLENLDRLLGGPPGSVSSVFPVLLTSVIAVSADVMRLWSTDAGRL